MRHRYSTHGVGLQHHQFSLVMQRIMRQTELLMQRRLSMSAQAAEAEHASLDGLEVIESTWDDWAEAVGQPDGKTQR